MTLEQALSASGTNTATVVDQKGYRVSVAQEAKRIRVSEGVDGVPQQWSDDIRTMEQFKEKYTTFYASDGWEAVSEAEA